MPPAALPDNETIRLEALLSCNVMDTRPEACFDDLTRLAAQLCDVPVALISLLDESRQWFKSRVGIEMTETPRDAAFCGHAILHDGPLIIPDALLDERTSDSPLVTGEPGIRFYAGVPLVVEGGLALGTLCVIDVKPREATATLVGYLTALATQATSQLELRRAAERLEQARREATEANQAKTAFLASMSHEVRTPLTAIVGFSDILAQESDVDAASQQHIAAISRNAQHLLTVVNDVLDVSKIEAGKLELDVIEVDLAEFLTGFVELIEPRTQAKSLCFELCFRTDTPGCLRTDPVRLRQILLNLASNAIKFTEHGTIRITVSASAEDSRLTFTVEDTGLGMSPEQLERVGRFEAFTQGDSSTTRRHGGSGLGLRIASQLAGLLGGHLGVTSILGEGSTFTLVLHAPGALADASRRSPAQAEAELARRRRLSTTATCRPKPSSRTRLAGTRILLAEDSPDSQRLIVLHLRHAGADVHAVADGVAAYDAAMRSTTADAEPYDIVLMDLQMPGIDGAECISRLRRDGFDRPIAVLTAHALQDYREQSLAAGADDYLAKPIDRERLIRTCAIWRHLRHGDKPAGHAA